MQLVASTNRARNGLAYPRLAAIDRASADARQADSGVAVLDTTLIRTKTQIPRVYGDIQRRGRLEHLFNDVRQRLLTLVMAPPGCGKSTLACQWAEAGLSQGTKVAWFSIDAEDNDPHRFMMYLHQAVIRAGFGGRQALPHVLANDAGRSPSETALAFINWIAEAAEELLIVLDNYAWITDPAIHGDLSYVLANAPSNLHIVILTSDQPPLPIGRLRARNQLLELNSGAIRFTKAEALELFRTNAVKPLPEARLEELYRFTEGWAAAVRIVSLTIGNLGNSPLLDRGIMDSKIFEAIDQYLDDLFVGFSAELLGMMADTSIVSSLSLPLCLALSASGDDTEKHFCQIKQQQILVPSESEQGRYAYPALVRQYLQKKLLAKGALHVASLHRRAYAWYSENAQWEDAVEHALAVGDTELAIRWMELHGMSVLKAGCVGTLVKWHQRVSSLAIPIPQRVCLSFAWAYAVLHESEAAFALLEQATAASQSPLSPSLQAECQVVRAVAFVLSDQFEQATHIIGNCEKQLVSDGWINSVVANIELYCHLHAGQWATLFSESSVLNAPGEGETNTHVLRLTLLGLASLLRGQLALAEHYFLDALGLAPTRKAKDVLCFSAWPAGLLAAIHYEQGRFDELEALLAGRLESIALSGYIDCTLAAFIAAARTAFVKGKLSDALSILERAEGIAIGYKWPRLEAGVLLERLRLFLDDGRLAEAEGCLQRLSQLTQKAAATPGSPICSVAQMYQIGKAHLAIHTGQAQEAIAPLKALLEQFDQNGNELFSVRMGSLLSIAYLRSGRHEEAESLFQETMEKAEKGGFLRSVIDQGADSAKLLASLQAKLRNSTANVQLRSHCERAVAASSIAGGVAKERTVSPLGGKDSICSPLTPKEHDVLALIAYGQSNKEIARNLNVAPETIKTHLKNIFLKLAVDRRIQAVAKAQAMGLLARTPG